MKTITIDLETILLSLCMLWSCGADDSTEGSSDSGAITLALKTYDDLPSCDASNENQLVYVKDENKFYECEQTQWIQIDIDGIDGINGSDGRDGINGTNGIDGTDGTDGVFYDAVWIDPFTDKKWILATVGKSPYWYPEVIPCESGYSIPTVEQALVASEHGIKTKAEAVNYPTKMWTTDYIGGGGHTTYAVDFSSVPTVYDESASNINGLYCRKDDQS